MQPVELLRDGRGIYGIGVSDAFDYEATACACGVDAQDYYRAAGHTPRSIILRPDLFGHTKPTGSVLQKISGGFRHGIFRYFAEEALRKFVHYEALRRAGLTWPPPNPLNQPPYAFAPWWSCDKAEQARNRGIYHGLRILSLNVINRLIGQAHEAAADPDAIRAARRFAFRHREEMYRAAALSRRALQLVDTFPLAALATYTQDCSLLWLRRTPVSHQQFMSEQAHRCQDAKRLVERGARLRDVAAALGLPLALRHIKPGVVHHVVEKGLVLVQHPELLQWMPASTSAARLWLKSVGYAFRQCGVDYARWVARHEPEMPRQQVVDSVMDVADWVRANQDPDPDNDQFDWRADRPERQFITRRFTPAMGLKAALEASHDWHEAVATNADCTGGPLPPAWYPAAKVGAFEITPVETAMDLFREGQAMHHCVSSYADRIRDGSCCVFSVRQNGERVATVSLIRHDGHGCMVCHDGKISIDQISGPCNTDPPKAVMTAVRRWLHAQPQPEMSTLAKIQSVASTLSPDQRAEIIQRIRVAEKAADADHLDIFPK